MPLVAKLASITKLAIRSPHEWAVVVRLALRNLRMNKLRTLLTVLGIVVGVMAVIVVMAGGAMLKDYVVGQIEAFGTDAIEVEIKVPGAEPVSSQNVAGAAMGITVTTLKKEDGEAVSRLSNVSDWYAGLLSQETVSYKRVNKRALLMGVTPGVFKVDKQLEIESGSEFTENDESSMSRVAVIGADIKESFFGGEDPVGKKIKIRGTSYRVVGTLKERGTVGPMSFDDFIYIPLKTLQKKIMGVDHVQFMLFNVKDSSRIEETTEEIKRVMRSQHEISKPEEEDFTVMSMVEAMEILESVFGIINILLLALTSISLVVGGVGIMNVMYVAVSERTREIGLRKAVGASSSSILRQFLFEAVFVTLAGGAVGIILGVALTYLLSQFAIKSGFAIDFIVPLHSLFIAAGFSVAVGIIFGIYPAYKASRLSPMEALKKE